jgi:outer membrane protein assembly factor BamB
MDYRSAANAPLLVLSTQVVALDRQTGTQLWNYEMGTVTRRFAISGEELFVFDSEGWIHCLDVQSGRLIGKVELPLSNANTMLMDGDRLYVSDDFNVIALDRTGRILWQSRVPTNSSNSLCGLAIPGGSSMQPDFSKRA